jgi:uncharacterized protein YaaR (DUF327 family)
MLKYTFTFEIDEDNLKEIFESYDIKFSKKKLAELKKEITSSGEHLIQEDMQERFEEIIAEWVDSVLNV